MTNARLIFGGVSVGLTTKGGISKPAIRKLVRDAGDAINLRVVGVPGHGTIRKVDEDGRDLWARYADRTQVWAWLRADVETGERSISVCIPYGMGTEYRFEIRESATSAHAAAARAVAFARAGADARGIVPAR